MNRKKIISGILCFLLAAVLLVGCGQTVIEDAAETSSSAASSAGSDTDAETAMTEEESVEQLAMIRLGEGRQ